MQIETEKILLDILQKEMDLADSQAWVYNQDFVMPRTDGLFIIAGMQYDKVVSNNSSFKEVGSDTVEVQNINAIEYIKISLMSKNNEARQRKNEVLMAMASFFSEQMQQKYSIKIAKIPHSFNNVSDAEGSTTINRFDIIVPVHVWYQKIKDRCYSLRLNPP